MNATSELIADRNWSQSASALDSRWLADAAGTIVADADADYGMSVDSTDRQSRFAPIPDLPEARRSPDSPNDWNGVVIRRALARPAVRGPHQVVPLGAAEGPGAVFLHGGTAAQRKARALRRGWLPGPSAALDPAVNTSSVLDR